MWLYFWSIWPYNFQKHVSPLELKFACQMASASGCVFHLNKKANESGLQPQSGTSVSEKSQRSVELLRFPWVRLWSQDIRLNILDIRVNINSEACFWAILCDCWITMKTSDCKLSLIVSKSVWLLFIKFKLVVHKLYGQFSKYFH